MASDLDAQSLRPPSPLTAIQDKDVQRALGDSGQNIDYSVQKRESEEIPGFTNQTSPMSSLIEGDEGIAITCIRATDVQSLGRLPALFYAAVQHSDLEWRTELKSLSPDHNDIEWCRPIPIPSNLCAGVCIRVFATFECQPVLGNGEELRKFPTTVERLLDHSARCLPFMISQEDENETTSACTSLSVIVGRKMSVNNITPHCIRSQSELEETTDDGHSAYLRYRGYGEERDLEYSIDKFERALEICPADHPCRAAVQSNLAEAKFMHYQLDNTDTSLDIPLDLYLKALIARPAGHPDRPCTLIHLAAVYFAQFEERRDEADAVEAETLLHEVKSLTSAESYESLSATTMLGQLKYLTRPPDPAQLVGGSSKQKECNSVLKEMDLSSLNTRLLRCSTQSGDSTDLEQVISDLGVLLRSTSVREDGYLPGLANLGVAFLERFRRSGDPADIERAISRLSDVVELSPGDDSERHVYLRNLGRSLKARFDRLGEMIDLEQAISRTKESLDLTPENDPAMFICLNELGTLFKVHFEHLGDLEDLEHAVRMLRSSVDLAPEGHSEKPMCLHNFGSSLLARFNRLGELNDLEQAILAYQNSVNLTPSDHPERPIGLSNLGNSLCIRFRRLGKQNDLDDAICRQQEAVNIAPDGHPNKPTFLDNLGLSFLMRCMHLGELSDLERAISVHEAAVRLTPDDHHDKPFVLSHLGGSFLTRFEHIGRLSDLEQAISMHQSAVNLTPDVDPHKPLRLNDLGESFLARFEHLGNLNDLDQAMSRQAISISLTADDDPRKAVYLNNLGSSFMTRFERHGELDDLQQAISKYKSASILTPCDHPDKPACLSNLGGSYVTRFERLGEVVDLEQAISIFEDVIELSLRLDGQPNESAYLNNLGTCLLTRFELFGEPSDLEQAISRSLNAVNRTPIGHPNKSTCLNNLGNSLVARFDRLGEQNDLEDAISAFRDAVELTPDSNIYKSARLNNLGKSLLVRFRCLGEPGDLEQAISLQGLAVDLTPDGHPHKPSQLNDLGDSFKFRFERLGEQTDLVQATVLYSRAACASIGPITDRFSASRKWISCGHILRHPSVLDAYSVAVGLVPQFAWIGLSIADRYRELRKGGDVIREAAAAALDSGQPETAVEWLEQGRSIVWGELFQLRSSYDELTALHPDHAHRLRELSVALEHAGIVRERLLSSRSEETEVRDAGHYEAETLEQEVDRLRMLAIERDKLLQEIRALDGFERFLLHKKFSQLRASAHSGPVVILNAAERRCDALIVVADVETVIDVPLPNYTLDRSEGFRDMVKNLLGPARDLPGDDHGRAGRPVAQAVSHQWTLILSPLWKCVVKPVLDALAFSSPGEPSRIFWCPTGPFTFLPIHAAGFHDLRHSQPGNKIYDFVVSSYVPTLSILAPSPELDAESKRDLYLLAVGQPSSDGLSRLPGVDVELEHIRNTINSPLTRTTLIECSDGTVEEVVSLMKGADWVHFACHGIQDARDATRSGLCLADRRRLQLSDLIGLSRSRGRGGLAFLSACQTARGDEELSDEAIHIAAAMLFAGYGGVVGTMWSISDRFAPRVAKDVYEQLLLKEGRVPDWQGAARALQDAVGRLRASPGVSFVDWLPFIHVGL